MAFVKVSQMPEISGIELCNQLKEDDKFSEAIEFYQAARLTDHTYLPPQIMLAVIMREQNQLNVALELLSTVDTTNRPDWKAWAYFERSLVSFQTGDDLSAACDAYQATILMPESQSYLDRLDTFRSSACEQAQYSFCVADDWQECNK